MASEPIEPCAQRQLIEAFAADKLDDAGRLQVETLLQQSEPCREYFRQLTAGRYPQLPNYTIIAQVGKGGFGVVYKAVHHAKERTEALKVLFSKTPLLTSYFQNEVRLIARLRHPGIATLHEAQLSTPPLYYTMEFVEGERLNEYLKRHEVSLAARLDIIKAVARAVGYAHGQGVVHRDLKPQNILIDADGQPHIVDFGIAKRLAETRAAGGEDGDRKGHEGPVGTLGYIAPEQEKGGPVDARADIFALGALLFHCVTGEPARLASVPDQRSRILRERQVPQPEDLSAIIGRCVEQSPDDRYATCTDLIADLDNYLAGRPIAARASPGWIYQAVRIAALVMRESPVTVRTAVLVLVAAFLTWYFWAVEAYRHGGKAGADRTVMIGFTDEDVRAIREGRIGADLPGLSADNRRSWRLLYGRLMERLAEAAPLVVVWDGWLDTCSEYDAALLDGLRAVRANGVPVVVAALKFDVNGDPEICEPIRAEIDGYGSVFGAPGEKHPNAYEVALCIQRGYEQPIPGLALAAFAAVALRNSDYKLELDARGERLRLLHRPRHPESGKSVWEKFDEFSLHQLVTAAEEGGPLKVQLALGRVNPDDKVAHVLVNARPNAYWRAANRTLTFEQVLSADTGQLRQWFDGRAIVVGHMRAREDSHTRGNGEQMFGCQVQAEAVDALLAQAKPHRFKRPELAARNVFWCGIAVLLASLLRPRRWRSLRWATLICMLLLVGGVLLGGHAGIYIAERWLLEPLIALTCFLTAGSLALWTKIVREHQLGLAPSAIRLTAEHPTLSSTVLAETR